MKDMLEMINATNKQKIASCLLFFFFFFLGVIGLGLGYRQLLGNIVSFGDIQAKT